MRPLYPCLCLLCNIACWCTQSAAHCVLVPSAFVPAAMLAVQHPARQVTDTWQCVLVQKCMVALQVPSGRQRLPSLGGGPNQAEAAAADAQPMQEAAGTSCAARPHMLRQRWKSMHVLLTVTVALYTAMLALQDHSCMMCVQ